jgi:hypothetical protein
MKDGCGDTPIIAVCQQTTLQYEEDAVPRSKSRMIQERHP